MADPTTLQLLLRELAMIARPVVELAEMEDGLTDPLIVVDEDLADAEETGRLVVTAVDRLVGLMREAGLEPQSTNPAVRDGLESVATTLAGLRGVVDAAIEGDPSAINAQDIANIHEGLSALAEAGQLGLPDVTPEEALKRLTDHLIARHLRENRRSLFGMLGLIGVVDGAAFEAHEPGQFRLDLLGDALGDPGGRVRAMLGVDEPDLGLLLRLIEDAIAGIGVQGDIVDAPPHSLAGHDQQTEEELQALQLALVALDQPVFVRLFLFLAELEADASGNAGLVAFLNGAGNWDQSVNLGDGWTLSLAADAALTPTFGVALGTSGLEAVTEPSAALPQSGVTLKLANPDRAYPLFRSSILNITSGAPDVSAQLLFEDGSAAWRIHATLPGTSAEITMSGGDGFLAKLIPNGASLKVDPKAGYDSREGFFLAPGQGLQVDLPVRFDLGSVLKVDGASLALAPVDSGLSVALGTGARSTLGPISAALDGLGADVELKLAPDSDTGFALDIALRLPTGVAIGINSGPVQGTGFLQRFPDQGRYAGGANLTIPPVGLTAFGLIDTQLPGGEEGFSFLLFVAGQFAPIPLGFGFNLTSVGGLVGLHRDVDTEALFAAVRTGAARRLMAPEDPVRDAAELTRDAQAIFPVMRGQHIFGPTAQITWGTPMPLVAIDLALALTLPDPLRLIFIAAIAADLPDKRAALVTLRIDAAGVLDFTNSRFDMEGRVYDSHIQGIPLSGGFAVRSGWGSVPELAFSVGGLHPNFEPPSRFPSLDRMALDLSRGSTFKLRIEGYFAITSNSLQLGAALDFAVQSSGYGVFADMGFDALLIIDPFSLDVLVRANAAIKAGGSTICTVRLKGRLTGPGPWRAHGSATIEILFFSISVGFDARFGSGVNSVIQPVNVLDDHLLPALSEPRHFRSSTKGGALVLQGTEDLLLPDSPLTFSQKTLPLDLRIDHFGGRPVSGPRRFALEGLRLDDGQILAPDAPMRERFAPGQYLELPESERLSAPAFEKLEAGAIFSAEAGNLAGPALEVDESPDVTIIDTPKPGLTVLRPTLSGVAVGAGLSLAGAAALVDAPHFTLHDESWQAADDTLVSAGTGGTWAAARADQPGATLARNAELEQAA